MASMMDVVKSHFQHHGVRVFQEPGSSLLLVPMAVSHGSLLCTLRTDDRHGLFAVYSTSPFRVAPDRRAAAVEAITRANYGLPLGNFECDLHDGEVRYKLSLLLPQGGELTDELVGTAMALNLRTHDRYLPALEAVVYRGVQPVEAVAEVEQQAEADRTVRRLLGGPEGATG